MTYKKILWPALFCPECGSRLEFTHFIYDTGWTGRYCHQCRVSYEVE
jgi:hypothetical protein